MRAENIRESWSLRQMTRATPGGTSTKHTEKWRENKGTSFGVPPPPEQKIATPKPRAATRGLSLCFLFFGDSSPFVSAWARKATKNNRQRRRRSLIEKGGLPLPSRRTPDKYRTQDLAQKYTRHTIESATFPPPHLQGPDNPRVTNVSLPPPPQPRGLA